MDKTNKVKELRLKAGMNQSELAEALGVTQSIISTIEKTGKMTTSHAIKLSEIFNVSTDYLLLGVDNVKPIEREILEIIRDDKTLFGKLIKMLEAKKTVIDSFEGVAA